MKIFFILNNSAYISAQKNVNDEKQIYRRTY